MNICCDTCKHCFNDTSTNTIDCIKDNIGEWIKQESSNYYNPYFDYCENFESGIDVELDVYKNEV